MATTLIDNGSAASCGEGRQGLLYWHLGHVGVAVPEGAARRRDAWLVQKKPVTAPLIGATKIAHLEARYVLHCIVGHW